MSDNEASEAPRRSPDIYTQIDQHGEMLDSEIQDLERMGVLLAEKSITNATDVTTLQQGPQIMGNNSNNDNNNEQQQLKSSIKAADKSSSTQGTSPSTTDEEHQHNNSSMTNVVCDNNSTSCNGAIIDNATTMKSSSSSNDGNEHSTIDHHQYDQIINNNNSSNIHEQLYTNLTNNLHNLHTSTQQSIQFSYMEQDHLFHDIATMTNRISYLQRQISLAREELIELGGDDMGDTLLRLSLVKEVDNICDSSCSNKSSEDDNDVDDSNSTFEVTYESFKPDNNEKTQQSSRRRRRGSLSKRRGSIQGSQTSGLSNTSHDTCVSQASGTSSVFRITFGGVDGMPSRWRAREEERERAAAAAALLNGSNKTTSSTSSSANNNERGGKKKNNTKEQQLNTLTQLVRDRESDITHLENEMIIIDKEKTSLENEVSILTTNITKSQSTTRNEKQKLMGVLDVCLLDNSRLGKELLETSVSLDERKMNVTLLGNELRVARDRFCNVHTKKEMERKEQRRKREQQQQQQQPQSLGNGKVSQFDYRSTSTKDGQSSLSNNKVVRYEVPTNAMDTYQTQQDTIITDEQQQQQRKPGSLRTSRDPSLSSSGKSEGGGSRATVMSALTMDSSDLVDVLEGLGVGDLT
jgi:hypothetical protein